MGEQSQSFFHAGNLICLLHLATDVVLKQLVSKSRVIQMSRHTPWCMTLVMEIIPFTVAEGIEFVWKKNLLHFYNWFNKVVTLHWCFPNCLLVVWNMVWSSGWWERWTLLCPFWRGQRGKCYLFHISTTSSCMYTHWECKVWAQETWEAWQEWKESWKEEIKWMGCSKTCSGGLCVQLNCWDTLPHTHTWDFICI